MLFPFVEGIENLGRNSWKLRSRKLTRYLINDAEINVKKNERDFN